MCSSYLIVSHGRRVRRRRVTLGVIRTEIPYLYVAFCVPQSHHEDHQRSRRAYREHDVCLCLSALCLIRSRRKGGTVEELHQVISWLTGFKVKDLQRLIKNDATFEQFFGEATVNPNAEPDHRVKMWLSN